MCDDQLKNVQGEPAQKSILYNLKGELFLAQRRTTDAEESFKTALKENPFFPQPYYALAKIYLMEKQEDKAIDQYKALLEKNPNQAGPHMLLGTIYDVQKRFDLAEKHYSKALDINPDFSAAANNLAYLLAKQDKNINKALSLAQRAKETLPDDPKIMDTLGFIYYKKGLYDNAIAEFTDSLEKIPDNAMVRFHLGLTYYKKGDKGHAKTELKKSLDLDQNFDKADEARQLLKEL
jgi:tetratricopeptide (TPR) repeat protein